MWFCAAFAVANAAAPPYIDACASGARGDACVLRALQRDGAAAVQVPGLASARLDALLAMARCTSARGGASGPSLREVTLPDGTVRRSLGARTLRGVAEPLDAGCAGLDGAAAAMRALVDAAARRLLRTLEPQQRGPTALLAAGGGGSYATLSDAAQAGEQLEHFHAYRPATAAAPAAEAAEAAEGSSSAAPTAAADAAVPLHVDAGLFIALVPALYAAGAPPHALPDADGPASTGGFYVQAHDGSRLTVPPEARSSSVVFVVGDGWAQWINPQLSAPLRAAPHAMAMPPAAEAAAALGADGGELVRVWYGRMYLPPPDAVQHPGGLPFSAWRMHHAAHPAADGAGDSAAAATAVTAAELAASLGHDADHAAARRELSEGVLPSGCGGDRRFLQTVDPPACLADQIWCWHQCVANPCGGGDALCLRGDGTLWQAGDSHCTDCQPACLPPPSSPPGFLAPPRAPVDELFCTGPGTDMHMSGFVTTKADCVILLFKEWKLDSAGAFAAGVIGVFCLGMLVEGLTCLRRVKLTTSQTLKRSPKWRKAVLTLAFTVQVTLGYLLMLVAMTYQAELFIAVMLGLGAGHLAFNVAAPIGESTDACCVEPVSGSLSLSATRAGERAASMPRDVRMVSLTVSPVHCHRCIEMSEQALRKVKSVHSVRVSASGDAEVLLKEGGKGKTAADEKDSELVRALASIGKSAKLEAPPPFARRITSGLAAAEDGGGAPSPSGANNGHGEQVMPHLAVA